MACKSCSSGGCGTNGTGETSTAGCKNNGACSTGGCNKMNVFDWLSNMDTPSMNRFGLVEIKFKGGRKEYFKNINGLELYTGDPVIVDVPNGHHLGTVSLQGELVRLQMSKKHVKDNDEIRVIYRKANEKDLEKNLQALARDMPTMYRAREIVHEQKINMKLSDVEFQADGTKATFYYSSDDRVDFRELIKALAGEFKVRVEMKQISLRQEAGRLGGIGVCGRELCCSTWLTDFKNVNTSAARYQNLSLNPVKLSGQCGRLKCCLNYELETYMDALKGIPTVDVPLQTQKGDAHLQKTDIFKRMMWFSYPKEENWYPVNVDRVKEILELNKQGIKPLSFEVLTETLELDINNLVPATLNSDLDKYDKYNKKKGKPNNNRDARAVQNNAPNNRPQNINPNNSKPQGNQLNPTRPDNRPQVNNNPNPRPQGNQPNPNRVDNRPQGNNPNPKPQGNQPNPNRADNRPQTNNNPNQKPQSNQPNPNRPDNRPQGNNNPNAKPQGNQPNPNRVDNRPQANNNPNQKPQGNQPRPNINAQGEGSEKPQSSTENRQVAKAPTNQPRPQNPNQNRPQPPKIAEGTSPTPSLENNEGESTNGENKKKNKRYFKRR